MGSKAAALVDLSTVAGNKISNPPWVKFQSAGWVNFPSAPTRYRTIACRKAFLQPLDRKGAFLDSDGQVWRIDGIHADDGDWITFYVVPE
ncbi:hypothetical protein [Pseudomonas aeruginosa]|uniref:hypothetical protein n=1 Tax=Pseudomonas aeruginosa TaxID=287 RepID=UPI003464E304